MNDAPIEDDASAEDAGGTGEVQVGMRLRVEGGSDEELVVDAEEQERLRELIEQTLEEEKAKHPEPKTPEEAEHLALEQVFDDIRHESHYGRLVTRAHWEEEGFVPAHMDDDAFAQLVFDTLAGTSDGAQDTTGEEVADAEEEPRTDVPAEPPETEPEEPIESTTEDEADEPTVADGEDSGAPDSAAPELAPLVFDDIVVLEGTKANYLYSNREMTDAFAKWSFLAAEDDKVAAFVSTVREESEVYPRPMREDSLTNDPFDMTIEEVRDTWDIVRESGDYPDIATCSASNGDVFYYSTEFLEDAQAEALAEYYAVRRFMSP